MPNFAHDLRIEPLAIPARWFGPLRLLAAWQLASRNSSFGGYSALLALPDGRLLAGSDRGEMLIFTPPGVTHPTFEFAPFGRFDGDPWGLNDLESLTRDPASGRIWAGFEVDNRILRLNADFSDRWLVAPRLMRGWPHDYGPEAMVRLADGHFVVLAEQSPAWFARTSPGVLFARDPIAGGPTTTFEFARPDGYSPTDMAQLPDGRLLVLLRHFRFGLPPRFPGKIALADPASIRPGTVWHVHVIGDLEPPLPSDNFEGVAVQPQRDGSAIVWLISDDNRSPFQRTLLLKFRWTDMQRAPGSTERP
ncbi:MAG: esterase-like activity of phytase family protein [Croceibacterium sp.]